LQLYTVVEADAVLEIGTALISDVLSLDEQLSHTQTLPVSANVVTSRYIVLLGTLLSGYALLNASRTAANYISAK
jgi:hypothetical protein